MKGLEQKSTEGFHLNSSSQYLGGRVPFILLGKNDAIFMSLGLRSSPRSVDLLRSSE